MLKFNNEHIFTGYLKQLLASFNLPQYRIYTKEDGLYHEAAVAHNEEVRKSGEGDIWPLEAPDIVESILVNKVAIEDKDKYNNYLAYNNYIKNNTIQRYVNGAWVDTGKHFHYNKRELNHTKNLVIKSNVYDSYTHEYLGEYLRFLRDYHDLNLMPLYNCFSNVICNNIFLKTNNITLDSSNSNYKIYMLPIKLFKKYTIAIDCPFPVEICCACYDKYLDTRSKIAGITDYTYQKYSSMLFDAPQVYNKLEDITDPNLKKEIVNNEEALKLFIKIPASNNSSIVILEGDYSGYGQAVYKSITPEGTNTSMLVRKDNHTITNYETQTIGEKEAKLDSEAIIVKLPEVNDRPFNPITPLQLLAANTNVSYPFADRLIEYLIGNAVTLLDEHTDNIRRFQETMRLNGIEYEFSGAWENKYRNIIYDYMNSEHDNYSPTKIINANRDCLGYLDKDAEKWYTGWVKEKDIQVSVSQMDLYNETYGFEDRDKFGGKK